MHSCAKISLSAAIVCCSLLASACQSLPKDPPPVVDSVNLHSYAGLWYELARLPVTFQAEGSRAKAEYSLSEDGTIELKNTAIASNGATRSVTGTAVPVEGSKNAQLKVTIDNFFAKVLGSPPDYGNYWIFKLAPDYSLALVGSPNRKTLWLLSRESEISEPVLQQWLNFASGLGFETDKMLINNGSFK